MRGPVSELMSLRRGVALGVAERLRHRELDDICAGRVVRPVAAVTDDGAGRGEEVFGSLDQFRLVGILLEVSVVLRRQLLDLRHMARRRGVQLVPPGFREHCIDDTAIAVTRASLDQARLLEAGVDTPTFDIGDDEIELGVGIHGEPGRVRRKIGPASELVEIATTAIFDDYPFGRGDEALVFVNGMGGTPLIELYVVFAEVAKILEGRGIKIARTLVGSHVTSLDMAGYSLTLLKLDDELTPLWDAPVKTPALRWGT